MQQFTHYQCHYDSQLGCFRVGRIIGGSFFSAVFQEMNISNFSDPTDCAQLGWFIGYVLNFRGTPFLFEQVTSNRHPIMLIPCIAYIGLSLSVETDLIFVQKTLFPA